MKNLFDKQTFKVVLNKFLVIIYFYCNFGPNCLEGPCLFILFCPDTLYVWISFSIEGLLTFD